MQLTVMIDRNVHEIAIATALKLGTVALPPDVANAIEDESTGVEMRRVWDSVEAALSNAYNRGMSAAREYIKQVSEQLAALAETATERARAIHQGLMSRLAAYLAKVIDTALEAVRPSIVVGGSTLAVGSVTIDQKVKLSGSVKASLESICEFIAEGEISLSAEYGSNGR
jgi:hypothetical protein